MLAFQCTSMELAVSIRTTIYAMRLSESISQDVVGTNVPTTSVIVSRDILAGIVKAVNCGCTDWCRGISNVAFSLNVLAVGVNGPMRKGLSLAPVLLVTAVLPSSPLSMTAGSVNAFGASQPSFTAATVFATEHVLFTSTRQRTMSNAD